MSDVPYRFVVNSPRFIFHFGGETEFQEMMDTNLNQAIGYLQAIGEFSRVINERAKSDLTLQQLKTELLGLVSERGEFCLKAEDMFP